MHPSYYIICSVQLLRQLVKSRITCQVWGVNLHASVLACISDSHVVMRGPCSFTTRDHSGSLSDKATTCGKPRFGASGALKNIRSKKVRFTPYKIRLKSPPKRVRCLGTFQAAATPSMSLARFYSVACSGSALTLAPMIGLLLLRH
jgi:hypothetical protein